MKIIPNSKSLLKTIGLTLIVAISPFVIAFAWLEITDNSVVIADPPAEVANAADEVVEPVYELEFSEEQVQDYYAVYQNPFVIAIRAAFDNYLAGKTDGRNRLAETAIAGFVDEADVTRNLDAISKEYYRSKFVVFARFPTEVDDSETIYIVFQDKPDRVFDVEMFRRQDGGIEMASFAESMLFNKKEIEKFNIQYRRFLNDKVHAL